MVIQMSEVHLRNRLASAKAVARKAPVKSMTGFVVDSSAPVTVKVTGVPIFDGGNLVGFAPEVEEGDE